MPADEQTLPYDNASSSGAVSRPHPEGAAAVPLRSLLRDYWALTKPEITFLVVISAGAGFLLGSGAQLDPWSLAVTLVGVALCSGGAGVLNHCYEAHLDAKMKRTARRPLPAGRVSTDRARIFGFALAGAGVALICPLINPLTSILAALSVVLYLYVYTPLKQVTPLNTYIGTVPGALPALGGWTAATGNLEAGGWSIFAVLAVWQIPHFLSLAWMYRKDYGRAGYAMLPNVEDGRGNRTALHTLVSTALLLLVSLTPPLAGVAGPIYVAGALPLGIWFLAGAWTFYRTRTNQNARKVLKISIFYIPLLLGVIFVDWLA